MRLIQLKHLSQIDRVLKERYFEQLIVLDISHGASRRWDKAGLKTACRPTTPKIAANLPSGQLQNTMIKECESLKLSNLQPSSKSFKYVSGARKLNVKSASKNPPYKRFGAPLRSARNSNIELSDLFRSLVLIFWLLFVENRLLAFH